MKSRLSFWCLLFLVLTFSLGMISSLHAQEFTAFDQAFDHLRPGQMVSDGNTPNLQAVFGRAKVFQDHAGKGLTPDIQLFKAEKPVTFINLSGAQLGVAFANNGEYDLILHFSSQSAKPANPFGAGSHMMLQVQLRQSELGKSDGLSIRFYVDGKADIWNGEVGKSKPQTVKGLGLDREKDYELVIRHTPAGIKFLIDGEEKGSINTVFSADKAGYISFGRASKSDYNAVKVSQVALRKIGDRSPLASAGEVKKSIVPANVKPIALPVAKSFPRLAVIHAMLWSGPGSPRFKRGFQDNKACGFYENAPLAPVFSEESNARITQMKDLADAGFNAIAIDLFPPRDGPHTLKKWLEAAQQSQSGIQIIPCLEPDRRASVKGHPEKNWPDILADFWEYEMDGKPLRHHPSLVTLPSEGDRVPVFLSYSYHGAETWANRLDLVHKIGGNAFVICETASIEVAVGTKVPERFRPGVQVTAGVYYFGSETVVLRDDGMGILPDFIRFGRSFKERKVIGATIGPGYIGTTRVGNLLSPRGTYVHRTKWLELLKYSNDVDFIHFSTANDYSEATEQECSYNSTFTFLDLNHYFLTKWRTNQFPTSQKHQAFLSYRKAVAQGEPIQMELVLLDPQLTGQESANLIASRYQARLQLTAANGKVVPVKSVKPEVLPGHVVFNFLHEPGIADSLYVTPQVSIWVDGQTVDLPQGKLAAQMLTLPGEEVARKWLRIPLHRVHPTLDLSTKVTGSPGNLYPRTIKITGLPKDLQAGGLIARHSHPLHTTLDGETLSNGFTEVFYGGPGFAPMSYSDGWIKRRVVDEVDRYSAVVRLEHGQIAFATPLVVDAPHVDPPVAFDYMPVPGQDVLLDRGPMRRDKKLEPIATGKRPTIMQDQPDKPWFMRFDGQDDGLGLGRLNFPAGPLSLEVWIRPLSSGKEMVINSSSGPAMTLALESDLTVRLTRMNQARKNQYVHGKIKLTQNRWHHLVGTYDGQYIQLYVDGQPDGKPARSLGVKTDELSFLGCHNTSNESGQLHADMARFCVRAKALSDVQIKQMFEKDKQDFQ